MDQLKEKHLDTTRGFHYQYYISRTPINPSQPLLLLCHGWPDGADLWQFVVPHLLRANLAVLVPDLLGYGGSSKPTEPKAYAHHLMAEDITEILAAEQLATQPLIPIGHDWGSFFAQRFYLLNQQRCVGLVNMSIAYAPPALHPFDLDAVNAATEKATGFPRFAYWELLAAPDGPALLESRLESLWHVLHGDEQNWMQRIFCVRGAWRSFLEQDRRDIALKAYARDERLRDAWIRGKQEGGMAAPSCWYRVVIENHLLEVERTLNGVVEKPYLFIGCDGDAFDKVEAIQPAVDQGFLKDATVHELHSGHWSPLERPAEVADLILTWLKEKRLSP